MSLKNLGLRRQGAALLLLSGFTVACNRPVSVQAQPQAQPQARNAEISLPGPNAVEPASFHCTANGDLVYTCVLTGKAKQAYLQAHPKPSKIPPMLPTLMPVPVTLPGLKAPASFSCTRSSLLTSPLETTYECVSNTKIR